MGIRSETVRLEIRRIFPLNALRPFRADKRRTARGRESRAVRCRIG